MKSKSEIKMFVPGLALALLAGVTPAVLAQQTGAQPAPAPAKQEKQEKQKGDDKKTGAKPQQPDERLEPDDTGTVPQGLSEEALAARLEQRSEEEAAVLPYYNNFLSKYRLGPEDVISVSVFGQERYSKNGIVVPPDGVISYYLVRGGIQVAGKTTQQVADEITRHLDEYIIEPKVTVSLEKAQSARYGVLGDVGKPGIMMMTRRLTVYEAVLEAGGVLSTGNKKKVILARRRADNFLEQRVIDIAAIEKGRAPDDTFLVPGDQIFVPGNRLKTVNKVLGLLPILSFARIFTGGIF